MTVEARIRSALTRAIHDAEEALQEAEAVYWIASLKNRARSSDTPYDAAQQVALTRARIADLKRAAEVAALRLQQFEAAERGEKNKLHAIEAELIKRC